MLFNIYRISRIEIVYTILNYNNKEIVRSDQQTLLTLKNTIILSLYTKEICYDF